MQIVQGLVPPESPLEQHVASKSPEAKRMPLHGEPEEERRDLHLVSPTWSSGLRGFRAWVSAFRAYDLASRA